MVSLKERLASFMAITIMNRIFIRHSSNVTLFSPLYEFFPASRNKIDRIIRTRSFARSVSLYIYKQIQVIANSFVLRAV